VTQPRQQASKAAIDLIKRFEGFAPRAVALPDGRWMIGHGHTASAREGAVVSEADAEALLIYDLRAVAQGIAASVFTPLSQNQFDALCSFAFNIGLDSFRRSAVVRRINAGALHEAALALEAWRAADFEGERIIVDALVRRRAAEKALFLKPDGGWIAAPSPEIEPRPDHAFAAGAADRPTEPVSPPEETEEALSPIEQAAANLAARLLALAPEDEPAPAGPRPFAPPPSAAPLEPETEADLGETAPFPHAPHGAAELEPSPRGGAERETDSEALRRRIFGIPEPRPKAQPGAYTPLALLGATGMALFFGAVVWGFKAKPPTGPIPVHLGVVIAGLIGIACVASAVYLILDRRADDA
jgi:lysozyme